MKRSKKKVLVIILTWLILGQLVHVYSKQRLITFGELSEKMYDNEIRKVVYGETQLNGKIKLYPQVIMLDDHEVYFYNEKGDLLRKAMSAPITISPDGNYIGLQRLVGGQYSGKEKMLLFTADGQLLWEKEFDRVYEGSDWVLEMSDKDGSSIRISGCRTKLIFFDPEGNEKREVCIFKDNNCITCLWEQGRSAFGKYSKNGEYFAVLAQKRDGDYFRRLPGDTTIIGKPEIEHPLEGYRHIDKEKAKKRKPIKISELSSKKKPVTIQKEIKKDKPEENLALLLFNHEGDELWRTYLDLLYPKKLYLSDNGEYIVVLSFGFKYRGESCPLGIYLFNTQGVLIKKNIKYLNRELGISLNFQCCFDENNRTCIIGNANWILMLDTGTGNIVWEKEFPWEIRKILKKPICLIKDIKILDSKAEQLIIVESSSERRGSGGWFRFHPQFTVLDIDGNIMNEITLDLEPEPPLRSIEKINQFEVSSDGSEIFFDFGYKMYSIKLK